MLWIHHCYPRVHVYRELHKRITIIKLAGAHWCPHSWFSPLSMTTLMIGNNCETAGNCLPWLYHLHISVFFCQGHWALGNKNKYQNERKDTFPFFIVIQMLDVSFMFSKGWAPQSFVYCSPYCVDCWQPQMQLESHWLPLWRRKNITSTVQLLLRTQ